MFEVDVRFEGVEGGEQRAVRPVRDARRAKGELSGDGPGVNLPIGLITGERPFPGTTTKDLLEQVAARPRDPRSFDRSFDRAIPEEVAALTLALLAERPEDRPATGRTVHDALVRLAGPVTSADASDFADVILRREKVVGPVSTTRAVAPRRG